MEKQRQPSQADWSLFDVSSLGSRTQEKAEWELFGSNLRPRRRAWTLCARAWRARIEAGAWRSGRRVRPGGPEASGRSSDDVR